MAVIDLDLAKVLEEFRAGLGDPRFPDGYQPDPLGRALLEGFALVIDGRARGSTTKR